MYSLLKPTQKALSVSLKLDLSEDVQYLACLFTPTRPFPFEINPAGVTFSLFSLLYNLKLCLIVSRLVSSSLSFT